MDNSKLFAGLDLGHITTKAVLMKGQEILGYATVHTGFDIVAAAETTLNKAMEVAGITREKLSGIVSTGIFKDKIKTSSLNITATIPDYMADAKGAIFLDKDSRTVIDIGGNIVKAISYNEDGNLINVIQNDKCADGMGIFYTSAAKAFGMNELEFSELALKSTKQVFVDNHCAVSAQSEAFGLLCQGVDIADVADAMLRFISERVAGMASNMTLAKDVVVAGGLAKSKALMKHLEVLLQQEIHVLNLPDYVGAIGAATSFGGAK